MEMHTQHSFEDLRVGQYVIVNGKSRAMEGFLAVEIAIEPERDDAELQSAIEHVDLQRRRIVIFDQEVDIDEASEIKDRDHHRVDLAALQPGQMVKLKGTYSASGGFAPKKIRMKETMGFNIEELRGVINRIDRNKRALEVNGITVLMNDKTSIGAEKEF